MLILDVIVNYWRFHNGCTLNGIIAANKNHFTYPINHIDIHQCASILTI